MVKKSNLLKNLLTTASLLAVATSSGTAYGMLKKNDPIAAPTLTSGGGANLRLASDDTPTTWANGDSFYFTSAKTLDVGGNVEIGAIDLAGIAAGPFNVLHNVTVGSIINSTGAQTLATTVTTGRTLTLNNAAGLNKNNVAVTGGDFSALGTLTLGTGAGGDATLNIDVSTTLANKIVGDGNANSIININASEVVLGGQIGQANAVKILNVNDAKSVTLTFKGNNTIGALNIGNGSELTINDGVNITAANGINALAVAANGQGALIFKGNSTITTGDIGATKRLNAVTLAGQDSEVKFSAAGAINYSAKDTNFTATGATLKFNAGAAGTTNTNFINSTGEDNQGTIIFTFDNTHTGNIGEQGAAFKEIQVATGKTLTFKQDNGSLFAETVVSSAGNDAILTFKGTDFQIHANLGTTDAGKSLGEINFSGNAAGTAASTFTLSDGFGIVLKDLGTINLAAANNNTLVLAGNNTIQARVGGTINITGNAGNGILSIQGDNVNLTDTTIGAGVGAAIDQLRFDSAGTLNMNRHTISTTNGIKFADNGTLNLTANDDFTFNEVITIEENAAGFGIITLNNATAAHTLTLKNNVGDVTVANKYLSLLQATGGANIALGDANAANKFAIGTIDIGHRDSTLTLVGDGNAQFSIQHFAHEDGKGNIVLGNNTKLLDDTAISGEGNRLHSINLADHDLTIGNEVNLYTDNSVLGGIRTTTDGTGNLIIGGNSTIGAVVGNNVRLNGIQVTKAGSSVHFLEKINIANQLNLNVDGITSTFDGEVHAGSAAFGANNNVTFGDAAVNIGGNTTFGANNNVTFGDGAVIVGGNATFGDNNTVTFNGTVALNTANKSITIGQNSTFIFGSDVHVAQNITIGNASEATFNSNVTAAVIRAAVANNGTVEFRNKEASVIAAGIGTGGELNTVVIAGGNIEFQNADFKANNIIFDNREARTATFTALGADQFQNSRLTTTGNGVQNIVLNNQNQTFNQQVGDKNLRFGDFILSNDGVAANKQITIGNKFYGSIRTQTANKGTVLFNSVGGARTLVVNVGSEDAQMFSATFNNRSEVLGDIWTRTITLANNSNDIIFHGVVATSDGMTLNNASIAEFTGNNVQLKSEIDANAAGQGTVRFSGKSVISKSIGSNTAIALAEFNGDSHENDIAEIDSNISANTITVKGQQFKLTGNVTLSGQTTFDGSYINLGTNALTLQTGGNNRLTGDVKIGVEVSEENEVGSIVVNSEAVATTFDASGVGNNALIFVTDKLSLNKEVPDIELITSVGDDSVIIQLPQNIKVQTNQRFVKWTLAGNNLVRSNNAKEELTTIFTGKDAALTHDALVYSDSGVGGKAVKFITNLGTANEDSTIVEGIERISQQTSVHANTIVSNLNNAATNTINGRIGTFSHHPQPGVQLSQGVVEGVSAGDEHEMFGAWFSPFYSTTTQKERKSISGFKSESYGGTIGIDTKANADLTVGVAGTYAKTDVKYKNSKSGDKTNVNTFMVSIYAIQQLTDSWFLQAQGSFSSSRLKNSEKRVHVKADGSKGYEFAKASFDTTSYGAELQAGYAYAMDNFTLTPSVGFNFTRINSGGYEETGTTNQNLKILRKAMNKLDAIAGLRGQMETTMDEMNLFPYMHAFVRHNLIGKDPAVTTKHDGLDHQLTAKKAKSQKTTFNFGLGVNAESDMWEYGAGYDLFVANKSIGHQGTIKVRVNF